MQPTDRQPVEEGDPELYYSNDRGLMVRLVGEKARQE